MDVVNSFWLFCCMMVNGVRERGGGECLRKGRRGEKRPRKGSEGVSEEGEWRSV